MFAPRQAPGRVSFSAPDGGGCPSGDAIFTKDAVTSVTTQLIDPQTQTPELAFSPAWSSDGTRIVFGGLAGTATTFDIFVMAANGGGITNLSNSAGFDDSPAWQP